MNTHESGTTRQTLTLPEGVAPQAGANSAGDRTPPTPTIAPPGPATGAAGAEEPLRERLWRQIETGRLDEERLLPAVETRRRQLEKKLAKPLDANGWRKFVSGQAHAIATGKAPQRRNAEVMLVDTVARWRRDVTALCPERLERLVEIVNDGLARPEKPAPRD